ncbi:prepilin-type N-terminal cleavage/methylation domain-containing protein [Candidatus Uhrbacteria bacterium]|nr:prepilin-type N-terminal cleavage/methylation domain-containing protein [Candidatus Uhrbacteria bacterium]
MSPQGGFSVIELLIVLAILTLLLASVPFVMTSFQESRLMDTAVQSTVQSLRRAQVLSQAVEADASWGVFLQTGSVTLFQGSTYAARNTTFDEVLEFSDSIQVSGVTEVVFEKLTGEPSATGELLFESDTRIETLTIFETGALQYE